MIKFKLILLAVPALVWSATACAPQNGQDPRLGDPNTLNGPLSPVQPGDLTRAAYLGDDTEVARLIRNGADIQENLGTADAPLTPLSAAVLMGHPQTTRLLLDSGASPYSTYDGYSLFELALAGGDEPIAGELFRSMYDQRSSSKRRNP